MALHFPGWSLAILSPLWVVGGLFGAFYLLERGSYTHGVLAGLLGVLSLGLWFGWEFVRATPRDSRLRSARWSDRHAGAVQAACGVTSHASRGCPDPAGEEQELPAKNKRDTRISSRLYHDRGTSAVAGDNGATYVYQG